MVIYPSINLYYNVKSNSGYYVEIYIFHPKKRSPVLSSNPLNPLSRGSQRPCRCHKEAPLLSISVNTLMRHIGPVALEAGCLSGERGQQGERAGLPVIALFSTVHSFPLIISPFSNFSCHGPGQITLANSPLFHQYSVIFSHYGIIVWWIFAYRVGPTVQIPRDRAKWLEAILCKAGVRICPIVRRRYVNTTWGTTTTRSDLSFVTNEASL